MKEFAKQMWWANLIGIVVAVFYTFQSDTVGYNEMFSVILGLISWLIAWIPILGFATSIPGLILGIKTYNTIQSMATIGVVVCTIGLILSIISSIQGFRHGASGKL